MNLFAVGGKPTVAKGAKRDSIGAETLSKGNQPPLERLPALRGG